METEKQAEQKASSKKKDEPTIEVKEVKPDPKAAESVSRTGRAEAIIRRNVLWSLGAGIVPIPIVDALAVTGVQIKMLSELSNLYEVKFSEDIAQKIIGSLLSGLGGVTIGVLVGSSIAKAIPGVGTALGIISTPIIAGAFTHATGKVFLMHFESGGTLLDFDPQAMRAYFKQEFEKAKETVSRIQKEEQAKTANPS